MPTLTHPCPAGCGAVVLNHRFACRPCWYRLPRDLREPITATYRVDPDAHHHAMSDAVRWYADNPKPPPPTRADAAAALVDLADVLAGTGKHADHERRQIGRCVVCSCGARVQGVMS